MPTLAPRAAQPFASDPPRSPSPGVARAALAVAAAAVVLSGIGPKDRLTWLMEVAPVLLAAPILVATRRRFPLTPLLYVLLAVHACILALGGHYTYAEVPLGFWVRDALGLARNHYDRLGHLAQGFVPVMLVREVLLRATPLRPGGWLFLLATSVALAASAFYEFVEWWAALLLGQSAEAFLGTQGDPWDTQWDMFLCFVGAVVAQLLLARVQDRQLARMGPAAAQER
jgi:putative membrane protein